MKHLARLLLLLMLVSPAFAARTFNNTASDHLDLASAPVAAAPVTISAWSIATNAADADVLVTLGRSGVNVDRFSLEHNGGHCAINVRDAAGTNNRQSSTTSYSTATQFNCIGMSVNTTSRTVWLNGAGKSNGTAPITQPVGVNVLHVSGDQNNGANFFTGSLSHVAIWNVAFTDTQAAYIGAGGNPRYIPGLIAYYPIIPATSPEPDVQGGTGLTVTGTGTSTADPVVASFWAGSNVPDQSWTQGGTFPSIAVDSNFMPVNSACTASWKLLGAPSNITTTSGAGTASREIIVASAAAIAAGDYLRVNGGSPTQVLWVNGTTILLRDAQTWTNGNNVDEYPVNAATIAGAALSSGSLSGAPSGTQAITSNYFFRCTNNTTATLIADSNLYAIGIASSGNFLIDPSIQSVTATSVTIAYSTLSSGPVAAVACKVGTGTPTGVEVTAHQCAGGAANQATGNKTSNGADTIVLSPLGPIPLLDIFVADALTRVSLLNTCLAAPAGKQILNCPNGLTSIAASTPVDLLNATGISPPWAIGDILICDLATTPSGYALTMSVNGNLTYTGLPTRQYVNCINYDASVKAMHADDLDLWFNNADPICWTGNRIVFFFRSGVPITPVPLGPYASDPDLDTLVIAGFNLHGLSVVGNSLTGTFALGGTYTDPNFTATDIAGASCAW